MKCVICKKTIYNNCCVKCELNYREGKLILDRHCWNLEEYVKNVKRKNG